MLANKPPGSGGPPPPPNTTTEHASTLKLFPGFVGSSEADRSRYVYDMFLSRGSSGSTYLVRRCADGQKFALKVVPLPAVEEARLKVETEIRLLRQMDHFACIKLVEQHRTGTHILLVLEYCDAGDLAFQIKSMRAARGAAAAGTQFMPEYTLHYTLLQTVLGLHYMHHCRKVLHRDLKPANVLVTTVGVVKIGDFGLSNEYETISGDVGRTICGTPPYVAPELWQRRHYGRAADMWSLGVLLYECMTGRPPFTGTNLETLRQSILHEAPAPLPAAYSQALRDIVTDLLRKDPRERPDTAALLNTPLLRDARAGFPAVLRAANGSPELIASIERDIAMQLEAPSETHVDRAAQMEGAVDKLKTDPGGGTSYHRRYLTLADGMLYIDRSRGSRCGSGNLRVSSAGSDLGSSQNTEPPLQLDSAPISPLVQEFPASLAFSSSTAPTPVSAERNRTPLTSLANVEVFGNNVLALRLADHNYMYFRTPDAPRWQQVLLQALGWAPPTALTSPTNTYVDTLLVPDA